MASALRWSAAVIAGVALALLSYALLGVVMLRLLKLWFERFGPAGSPELVTTPFYVAPALIVTLGGVVAARIARRHRGSAGMAVGVVMLGPGLLVAARWPDAGGFWPYVGACLAGGTATAWIGRRMR